MRLHILSDLHLEFGAVKVSETNADVIVLAGDIHLGREGRKWIRQTFPGKPVVYVLGNHEFYRHSLPDLTETLRRETEGSNIHVLERTAVEIDGYTFLGCTLWTDFEVNGDPVLSMRTAETIMSDYMLIDFSPENRTLRAADTIDVHVRSRDWLKQQIARSNAARTIVVTHHAPSPRSEAPHHRGSPLAPAFSSNLDSFVEESGVPLWIYGHTHFNTDFKIGATRVMTNQRGYPDECCRGFDPGLVVEV